MVINLRQWIEQTGHQSNANYTTLIQPPWKNVETTFSFGSQFLSKKLTPISCWNDVNYITLMQRLKNNVETTWYHVSTFQRCFNLNAGLTSRDRTSRKRRTTQLKNENFIIIIIFTFWWRSNLRWRDVYAVLNFWPLLAPELTSFRKIFIVLWVTSVPESLLR